MYTTDSAVVYLNFETLNIRECVGEDEAETGDKDYEIWRPSGKVTK